MNEDAVLKSAGTVGRAEPPEETLMRALQRLVTGARMYGGSHQVLSECAEEFVKSASWWWDGGEDLTIQVSHEHFLIQEEKLKYRRENIQLVREMLRYFDRRGLRGIRFGASLRKVPMEDLLAFTHLLNRSAMQEDPADRLMEQIVERGYSWVEVLERGEEERFGDHLERKERAKRTYAFAADSIKEVSQKIAESRRAGVRKIKRVVQNMVDLLMEDESALMYMATIRDHDDYTFTHSVNVAILALCLGRRIGLSPVSLRRLGICALVHDLGKVEIPLHILNKPGRLSGPEREEMERHPLKSVAQIIKLKASRELKAKIMLPPFEHHLKYDLSGYPRLRKRKPVSLFGRILTIVDVFDAVTSPRIYRRSALSPDKAVPFMIKRAGKDFDPILLKVFIRMLGVYPIGTLLRMDTGELGLVLDCPEGGDRARPSVVLLSRDDNRFVKGKSVDLSDRDSHTGAFLRNVEKSFHPAVYGIQPAQFLL